MDRLRELDQVAYIRFASVYRRFEDVDAFMDVLAAWRRRPSWRRRQGPMATRSAAAGPDETIQLPDVMPVLPLKDRSSSPTSSCRCRCRRPASLAAVDQRAAEDRMILLVAQRDPEEDEPDEDGLYRVGTAAAIMRMLKLPDGRVRILVQGLARVRFEHFRQEPFLEAASSASKSRRADPEPPPAARGEALVRSVKEKLDRAAGLGKGSPPRCW